MALIYIYYALAFVLIASFLFNKLELEMAGTRDASFLKVLQSPKSNINKIVKLSYNLNLPRSLELSFLCFEKTRIPRS